MSRRRGFTLIEALVAAVILVVVIGVALALFIDTNKSVGGSMEVTGTAMSAQRLAAAVRQELRGATQLRLGATGAGGVFEAAANGLSPGGEFTSIQYRLVEGYDATSDPPAPLYGALRELRFTYDMDEEGTSGKGNGRDDDGDRRIDEGTLSLFVDANDDGAISNDERVAVLAHHVSGDDLSFALPSGQGEAQTSDLRLDITFTVLHRPPATGAADGTNGETRTLTVPLRNKT